MLTVLKCLLDANIVLPHFLSALFVKLSESDLCQVYCSEQTLSELRYSLFDSSNKKNRERYSSQVIDQREADFRRIGTLAPNAEIAHFGGIGPQHTPDKADWYLIATALEAGLDIIVSQDKRFRGKQIKKDFGITVMTADKFLLRIHKHHSVKVARTVSRMLSQTAHDPHRPLLAEAPRFETRIRRALGLRSF